MNFRTDDFHLVFEAFAQSHFHPFGDPVLVEEHVTVVGPLQLQHGNRRHDQAFIGTDFEGQGSVHARTEFFLAVRHLDFNGERPGCRVDGRIDDADFPFERPIGVDVAVQFHFHAFLHFQEILFGKVHVGFERVDFLDGDDGRLGCPAESPAGIDFAVFKVFSGHHSVERRDHLGIFLEEVHVGLGHFVLGHRLVVGLLADAVGFLQGLGPVVFGLEVFQLHLGLHQLGAVHID